MVFGKQLSTGEFIGLSCLGLIDFDGFYVKGVVLDGRCGKIEAASLIKRTYILNILLAELLVVLYVTEGQIEGVFSLLNVKGKKRLLLDGIGCADGYEEK